MYPSLSLVETLYLEQKFPPNIKQAGSSGHFWEQQTLRRKNSQTVENEILSDIKSAFLKMASFSFSSKDSNVSNISLPV